MHGSMAKPEPARCRAAGTGAVKRKKTEAALSSIAPSYAFAEQSAFLPANRR
jgi:hypothetical protein